MTSLQTMIDQNNATVAFLQQQDFPNAVGSSATALELHQELKTQSSPDIISSADGACPPDCLDRCMLLFDVATSKPDVHHDGNAFVYDQGIVIPSIEMKYEEALSSILIFNSALAHQLYAQQQQEQSTSQRYLLKSKRLYELALEAYSEVDSNVLFPFAVMNNTGVIEFQTGNAALSTRYFDTLMPILMLLLNSGGSSRFTRLCGFLRNVSLKMEAASAA